MSAPVTSAAAAAIVDSVSASESVELKVADSSLTATATATATAAAAESESKSSSVSASSSASELPALTSMLGPNESYTPEVIEQMHELRLRVIELLKGPQIKNSCPIDGCWRDCIGDPENLKTVEYQLYHQPKPYPVIEYSHSNPSNWSPSLLYRFLKARKFHIEKSAEMLTVAIQTWIRYRAEELSKFTIMPFHNEIISIIPGNVHKTDRAGRPCYWQKTGKIHVDSFVNRISNAKLYLTHTHFTERMARIMEENSIKFNQPVTQCITILDLHGVGLNHRKTIKFFSITSWIDQNLSPERLYRMYFINSPSYFPVFWALIKPFLDPVTQSKIVILGKNYRERLLEDIGSENVPVEYGGICQCIPSCIQTIQPWPYPEEETGNGKKHSNYLTIQQFEEINNELEKIEKWTELSIPAGKEKFIEFHVKLDEFPDHSHNNNTNSTNNELKENEIKTAEDSTAAVNALPSTPIVDLQCWWAFQVVNKDIMFSSSYQPASSESDPTPTPIPIQNPTKSLSSDPEATDSIHRGLYTIPNGLPGSIKLIWDNKSSYFSGKTIKYKAGIRKYEHKI